MSWSNQCLLVADGEEHPRVLGTHTVEEALAADGSSDHQ